MPIDPSVAVGADLGSREFAWSSSDVLLYHLGIGAGARPGDNLDPAVLRWTADHDALQVLPSFGVVAPTSRDRGAVGGDARRADQPRAGGARVAVDHRARADPPSGRATQRTTLTDVWDKGKAAVIWQEATVTSDDGIDLWTTRSSIFVRGEGGFGGERGSAEPRDPGARARRRHHLRDHAGPGAALPAVRRPQPAARRSRVRRGGGFPGRSCTACAPTASRCASSSPPCSAPTRPAWPGSA